MGDHMEFGVAGMICNYGWCAESY